MLPMQPMVLLQPLHPATVQVQLDLCTAMGMVVVRVEYSAAMPPLKGQGHLAIQASGFWETALFENQLPAGCAFINGCNNHKNREERVDVWSNPHIRGNVEKTIGALKLHLLKHAANCSNELFGSRSQIFCMTFVLRKFPSQRKAMQISLAGGAMRSTEGLFLKTSTGKRTLSVQFGSGDSEKATLVADIHAILKAVSCKLDVKTVMEIYVGVDRLMLPIWSFKLWDRGKKRSEKTSISRARKTSMSPPGVLPRKRIKTA
mmetsp:Transcript_110817/g.196343  ORF Transcript_110817/g.196343 Transcript_110817/m.196343 type:complete len:260 (+) Transcript_110817:114-893(+)